MELKLCFDTDSSCKLFIKDKILQGDKGYLPDNSEAIVFNRFRYADTAAIDVLVHHRYDDNADIITEIAKSVFSEHTSKIESIEIPVQFDGWFTIYHLVLPTKEWLDWAISKDADLSSYTNGLYYIYDNKVYMYRNGPQPKYNEVDLLALCEANTTLTSISKWEQDHVSICGLRNCYLSLCKQIFKTRGFSTCWNKQSIDSDLIYRRDLAWMAINIITYMVEFGQLAEAERIIEQINGCNGLCKTHDYGSVSSGSGCGCTKV